MAGEVEFDPKLNLIVNYLPPTLSQDDVKDIFNRIAPVCNCKLVRNNVTGQSLGYAFIRYSEEESASQAINQLNGIQLHGKTIKVSHARQSTPDIQNANVYIAGLPEWINEEKLLSLFAPYGAVMSHKILTNPDGSSRGAGFVRYSLNKEANQAIEKMAGKVLTDSVGPLTVKLAIPPASKQDSLQALGSITTNAIHAVAHTHPLRYSPMATTPIHTPATAVAAALAEHGIVGMPKASVYVFGLQEKHTELTLYELFSPFGAVVNVKLIRDLEKEGEPCKGYGFINYIKNEDALKAVNAMNGVTYDDRVLQVSLKQNKKPGGYKHQQQQPPPPQHPQQQPQQQAQVKSEYRNSAYSQYKSNFQHPPHHHHHQHQQDYKTTFHAQYHQPTYVTTLR